MDYHTLQNSTLSSIENDTSSGSECSLDEKPQDPSIVENAFSGGVHCTFSEPIHPGNHHELLKSYSDDYEGVYDFVNEPMVSHNIATSLPNGTQQIF
jgi:hypothetical protein